MSLAGAEDRGPAEEAKLVAQIAAGDVEAPMTELYRRYSWRLYSFGIQVLGDTGLAEEMVQESFVRLWRTARSLMPAEPASAPTCSSSPAAPPPTSASGRPRARFCPSRRLTCRPKPTVWT